MDASLKLVESPVWTGPSYSYGRSTFYRDRSRAERELNKIRMELNGHNGRYSVSSMTQSIPNCPKNCKMSSHWNCQLTPFRTQLLTIGFSKLYMSCYVTMDIINIIIAYFDSQIVYNNDDTTSSKSIIHYIDNAPLLVKLEESATLKCSIYHSAHWNVLHCIIFRIRLYFITSKDKSVQTMERLIILGKYKMCTFNILSHIVPNDKFIFASEIEILYIRWNDGKTWSKWCYPWNDDKNDIQCLLKDDWFWTHFHKNCFGVNDKYFILSMFDENFIGNGFNYTKCRLLSKWRDMMVVINDTGAENEFTCCYRLVSLDVFIQEKRHRIERMSERLELLRENEYIGKWNGYNLYCRLKEIVMESASELASIDILLNLQRNNTKFVETMSDKIELLTECGSIQGDDYERDRCVILKKIVDKYKGQQASKSHLFDVIFGNKAMIAQKSVNHKSARHYDKKKAVKNCKIYRNNKKKYQYNRW